MLYYNTIEPATLELLKKLMSVSMLAPLRLVGGTALALHTGHRNSVDIDLFGKLEVQEHEISDLLKQTGKLNHISKSANINIYTINDIKVDIVNYNYPWLDPVFEDQSLRLAGLKDIAAMKLAAITGRGTKKDFIDLFFLLDFFSLKQMLDFYSEKYNDGSEAIVIKSLTYFGDADPEVAPLMYKHTDWENIKQEIRNQVKKTFKL